MNFSNRVHLWAKITLVSLVASGVSCIVLVLNLPEIIYFLPTLFMLITALSYFRWMDLAEKELKQFEENEPVLSKEIE